MSIFSNAVNRPAFWAIAVFLTSILNSQTPFSWSQPHSHITKGGDIQWAPKPHEFRKGVQVRYIDFENGSDENDGLGPQTAWKHHPWDKNAQANAAKSQGPVTYVFKQGVDYRGILKAKESGEPGNPIRLTVDPSWGQGPARIMGSKRLPSNWIKASKVEVPDRLPEIDKVWALDVKPLDLIRDNGDLKVLSAGGKGESSLKMPFMGLFQIEPDGATQIQHLARDPNWQPGNDHFVLDYWHKMDGKKNLWKDESKPKDGYNLDARGAYAEAWKGHPADYFEGGFFWMQYGFFMGGPMPREIDKDYKTRSGKVIPKYNPKEGVIYEGVIGEWAPNLRYMMENLPQYLDHAGEYYFDFETGYLFYRPREGVNPNDRRLEFSNRKHGVFIKDESNIEVAGLEFRYQNEAGVLMHGDVENVTVRNCSFINLLQNGIKVKFDNAGPYPGYEFADQIRITDCDFQSGGDQAIDVGGKPSEEKILGHIEILRNRVYNNGMRHGGNAQSAVPAIACSYPKTAEIAGNIVKRSWGTGIMVHGGASGGPKTLREFPLTRILVHHNKTENTALAINDYGGMSLWQGGPIYCYNNNIGNSPGYMPSGIVFHFSKGGKPRNLSYPLYLDGAYKVYSFNNIIWARSNDTENDEYATRTPGYFMVFGFLNQFVNNTLYRNGSGVGGSSGHRNDVLGNVFSEINRKFIGHDRSGDPSLIGGGDDGTSGQRGVPTLSYSNNVFYGEAEAGRLLKPNPPGGVPDGIEAVEVEDLKRMMKDFPIRYGELGEETQENPIVGHENSQPIEDISKTDFNLRENSSAIDAGVNYFIPWGLYGNVGEWHFTENHASPEKVIDYSWYFSKAQYKRKTYEFIPTQDLTINSAGIDDFTESPFEDWSKGALKFNGTRYGHVSDEVMRNDIELDLFYVNRKDEIETRDFPIEPWILPEPVSGSGNKAKYAEDAVFRFPGELRKTLIIKKENLLTEVQLKSSATQAVILGKHDGNSGYELSLDESGYPVLTVSVNGNHTKLKGSSVINDDKWHHIIAQMDRKSGKMKIFVDGKLSSEKDSPLDSSLSIDNQADFLVGKGNDNKRFFTGEIDFIRVCHGTLEDAQTTIEELYAWQTKGPFRYDFAGKAPNGKRDVGALEFNGISIAIQKPQESKRISASLTSTLTSAIESGIAKGNLPENSKEPPLAKFSNPEWKISENRRIGKLDERTCEELKMNTDFRSSREGEFGLGYYYGKDPGIWLTAVNGSGDKNILLQGNPDLKSNEGNKFSSPLTLEKGVKYSVSIVINAGNNCGNLEYIVKSKNGRQFHREYPE